MTTSQMTVDEDERQHRQRCADWFQQMYGKELEETFGFEPQKETKETDTDAE